MSYEGPIPGEGSGPQNSDWPTMPAQPSAQPQPGFGPPSQQPTLPNAGYGYPPPNAGYGYQGQQAPQGQPGPQGQYAQQGPGQPAYIPPARAGEPDWSALADQNESKARSRRRLRIAIGIVAALVVIGGVAYGATTLTGKHGGTPAAQASGSGTPTASAATQQLADANGTVPLTVGSGASVDPIDPGAGGQPGNGTKALTMSSKPESYALSTGPAVDTQNSFTVSAWVLNRAKEDGRTAVSQGDANYYAFDLGRDFWTKHNKWVFKVQTAAGNDDKTADAVYSKADATVNSWTFLTGTYDAKTHTIALYVNGQLQGSMKVPGIWSDTGGLQIGRLQYKGAWADHWSGQITHVETWNTVLTAAQVQATMNNTSTAAPAHAWLVN